MFLGRTRELEVLADLYESGRPELFVLYGRRRVGKTELLQRLCQGRRAVYFQAAQVRERDNLRAFQSALAEGLGDELATRIELPDWEAALGFALERSAPERLLVVLDEFPYLCEANKGLPSILQRFWDRRGKHSRLMLVLCGSQVSFMEKEVLAERSPLFGRRTGQRRLEPLGPGDALDFFPGWSLEDRLLGYGILGGMPAYLRRFDPARTLRENVLREILRPEGYLFDEVQFLLHNELNNPTTYNSLLSAVARGEHKLGDIALTVGVDSTTANKYLSVLRELGLVERAVPLTDPAPLRSRRGAWRIADRFLAFHFRHVQPHVSLIAAGRGRRVLEEYVEPDLPRLLDEAAVDLVIEHLARSAAELAGAEVLEAGPFPGRWIRAIARTSSGSTLAAVLPPVEAGEPGELESELARIRAALAGPVRELIYELGCEPERALEVELGPEHAGS